jgi:hypothetical protein
VKAVPAGPIPVKIVLALAELGLIGAVAMIAVGGILFRQNLRA